MAVIQEQPQLEAYVECDGERLPEFDTDENEIDATTTTTKYIESKSGAAFAVKLELRRPFPQHAMSVKLCIDGKHMTSRVIDGDQYQRAKASLKRTFDNRKSKTGEGQSIMQKFCFSELQIEDLDTHDLEATFTEKLKLMGTITLKAFYIQDLREVTLKGGRIGKGERVNKKRADLGPIPEKALKGAALTHHTVLGRAINIPSTSSSNTTPTRTTFDYVHPQQLPFATFNFKYRSRAALQSLLVIPRSPRSSPSQVKDEVVPMDNTTEPKREEAPMTGMKQESGLKREHSAVVARGDSDEVIFVSATKHQRLKKESGVKSEHLAIVAGDEDDKEVVFVSAAKRRRANITIKTYKNGAEIIDLT